MPTGFGSACILESQRVQVRAGSGTESADGQKMSSAVRTSAGTTVRVQRVGLPVQPDDVYRLTI